MSVAEGEQIVRTSVLTTAMGFSDGCGIRAEKVVSRVDRDAARDGEQGRRQIVDQGDADGPNAKATLHQLAASLEQLTSALLQTRFQTDASSRAVTGAVSRLRGTLVVCTVVLSLVIIAATLPRFVPITPVGRTWMLWHQVGGTWDPL